MKISQFFPTESVALIKQNGQRFDNVKALVQSNIIFTEDPRLPIEDGDVFERRTPSGVVERFDVIDAGFKSGVPGLGGHYESQVRKQTAPRPTPTSVVYNISGANSRVNIQSHDSSTNVVSVDQSKFFNDMRQTVTNSGLDSTLAQRLIEHVDALQASAGTKSFVQRYTEFVSIAADHLTLFGPFMTALAQLLTP